MLQPNDLVWYEKSTSTAPYHAVLYPARVERVYRTGHVSIVLMTPDGREIKKMVSIRNVKRRPEYSSVAKKARAHRGPYESTQ
jgi:hypothetical protein